VLSRDKQSSTSPLHCRVCLLPHQHATNTHLPMHKIVMRTHWPVCVCVCVCVRARARVSARTLLSVVALAGASSSLHSWSIRAVAPALEHDLVKALTGAHCVGGVRGMEGCRGSCLHSWMPAQRKPDTQRWAGILTSYQR
jgi:hypothetical protein